MFSVIPLLLLFCQCGTFGEFSQLPFDTKEYLIEYHTEGQGEDKVNYYYNFTHFYDAATAFKEIINVDFGCNN